MKKIFLRLLVFFFVPCVMLELALRILQPSASSKGYGNLIRGTGTEKINFFFIGSSRVGAAIETQVFDTELSHYQAKPRSENLGMGYSTLIGHYFGLKTLFTASKHAPGKCQVLIEATLGLPPMDTWDSAWFHPGQEEQLYPYLTPSDYWRFWQNSDTPQKNKLTLGWLMISRLAGLIKNTRGTAIAKGEGISQKFVSALVEKLRHDERNEVSANLLHSAAGIRNDPAGIRMARELVLKDRANAVKDNKQPALFTDWPKLVLRDLKRLAEENQCKVGLFYMPMSPSQEATRKNFRLEEQRKSFNRWARENDLFVLDTNLQFTDEDYPDLWHLSAAKSPMFTKNLASKYLAVVQRLKNKAVEKN